MNILLSVMISAFEIQLFTKLDLYIFLFVLALNILVVAPIIVDVFKRHAVEEELENRGFETMGEVTGVISKGIYTTKSGVSLFKIGDGKSAHDLSLATRLMAPRSLYYFKKSYDGTYIEYYVDNERHELIYPNSVNLKPGDTFPMLYLPEKPQVAKMKLHPVTEVLPEVLRILSACAIATACISLILMIIW